VRARTRGWTGMVSTSGSHKRYCAGYRSICCVVEPEIISGIRITSRKWHHIHVSCPSSYRILCSHSGSGPILGVIIGLGIFGLGIAKGIRTARAPAAAVYLRGVLTDIKESLGEARWYE
jgi:hypothetical protein